MNPAPTLRLWLRPGLVGLHVFAVVAIVFCVVMGLWQMGVYDSRQQHERADKQVVPRVALAGLWGPDQPFDGKLNNRPVMVEGRFAPADQQVWVTGKKQQGRTGAWLLAPLLVGAGGDNALLVVRGWSPTAGALPAVPAGPVTVDAVLAPGEGIADAYNPDRREIGSVRIPALLNVQPYDLYSGFAISTDAATAGGLDLVPPPVPGDVSWTVGLRNLAYALQWWVFGAFALFMWWRMATESVATSRAKVA
ncbi:SURF1 family protein [Aeromicrobium sp.]|uniref:SURF1 family protein n=1 Tax=Aeromicrobium sp. TaxID=1871063 RepID=UPI0019B8FF5C|nr:SURF1 family protein [Aeromicrobium sp.]MBC7631910.1 SURF1 family protein [Aeromicrobium sp.]